MLARVVLASLVVLGLAAGEIWDVGAPPQPGQLTVYNRTAGGAMWGYPLAAGDVNGDGRADLILTPMNAASGPARERPSAGEAIIVMSPGALAGTRDLAALDPLALPDDIVLIYGASPRDLLGTEVFAADLDGDGYDDVILGAQYGDGPGEQRAECGEVTIVWGGPDLGGTVLDLAAPPPGAVSVVIGAEAGDRLGVWVSAGDFDGDGIADAILGADLADGPDNARPRAGETYVVYGGAALRAQASVDLAAPALAVTRVDGVDPGDHSGATVRGLDVDRDGVDDLLIGAGLNRLSAAVGPSGGLSGGAGFGGGDGPDNACAPVTLNCEIGEAYVVYGARGARPAVIDLAAPPLSTTIVYGVDAGDAWGEELWAGDLDGDGSGDLAIGALTADGPNNTRTSAGELAVIFGGASGLRGRVVDLAQPHDDVLRIYGARTGAIAGDTAMLLDLDGDGLDDLVVASPQDQPFGRVNAGAVDIFFGHPQPWPAVIDLAAVPTGLPHLRLAGAGGGDLLAYSMGLGDVTGDGRTDLLLNAMGADGFENRLLTAGDAYALDAVMLARAAGREGVATATPSPSPTATPPPACGGDCDGDGAVTIDELVRGVALALAGGTPADCAALDRDGDGRIDIGELVAAVGHALAGC